MHVPECQTHGARGTDDVQFSRHAAVRNDVLGRKRVARWLEAVYAAKGRRSSHAAPNVAADAQDGAAKSNEGRLAAAGAPGREVDVMRVERSSVKRTALEVHDGLRLIGLAVEDGAGPAKNGHHLAVLVVLYARVHVSRVALVPCHG